MKKMRTKRGGGATPREVAAEQAVTLLPTQQEHVARMRDILRRHPVALDRSMLGAGKTFSTTFLAREMDLPHVVVIAPVSVKPKWAGMARDYGLRVSRLLGYSELRSTRCRQPRHGLLVRRDYTKQIMTSFGRQEEVDKVEFTSTRAWTRMVEEGALVVVDEIQHLKNVGSQFAAAQALIREVVDQVEACSDCRSRVILLSGSPFDRAEQTTTFFRTVGIAKHDELGVYVPSTGQMRWTGLQDIINHCERLDERETRRVMVRSCNLKTYAYLLFQQVVNRHQASSMPPPACEGTLTKLNAFYEVHDAEDRRRLQEGVTALATACMYNPGDGTVNFATSGGQNAGSIYRVVVALLQVETAKLSTLVRVADRTLGADPRRKVVICVNYTASIRDLRTALAHWDPLVLDGSVSAQRRGDVLARFQAPSVQHRLLIGNVATCSSGIDLDDKEGSFPRLALVSPNYSTISLYQLGQRFLRADSRSDATLHFVFGSHAHEANVLRALARKSSVIKATTADQATACMTFPGDYPAWHEGDSSSDGVWEGARYPA